MNAAALKKSAFVTLTSRTRPEDCRTNSFLPGGGMVVSLTSPSPCSDSTSPAPHLGAEVAISPPPVNGEQPGPAGMDRTRRPAYESAEGRPARCGLGAWTGGEQQMADHR